MDEPAVLEVAGSEPEAEPVCSILRETESARRITNAVPGVMDDGIGRPASSPESTTVCVPSDDRSRHAQRSGHSPVVSRVDRAHARRGGVVARSAVQLLQDLGDDRFHCWFKFRRDRESDLGGKER